MILDHRYYLFQSTYLFLAKVIDLVHAFIVASKSTGSTVARNTIVTPAVVTNTLYSVREAPLLPPVGEAPLLVTPHAVPTLENVASLIVEHVSFKALITFQPPL